MFPRLHVAATCVTGILLAFQPFSMASAQVNSSLGGFSLEQAVPWTSAGNGVSDNHYAANEYILSKYLLPYVSERWEFAAAAQVDGTPTVEGNHVYVADEAGFVYALRTATGVPIWKTSLTEITGNKMSHSRNSPGIGTTAVFVGDQASGELFALRKTDGKLLWHTTIETNPDALVTSSPVVLDGRVYVGVASNEETKASTNPGFVPTFRGSVVVLDEATGEIIWKSYTVPDGFTGGAVWESNFAIDVARNSIFVSTGNNYSVSPAVAACQAAAATPTQIEACLPSDDHIDSVMAMDLKTGAVKWSQRFTHQDTWTVSCLSFAPSRATPCPTPTGEDTDFGAGGNLFTVTRKGKSIAAIGTGQKSGAYFAMNRDTGEILWGTQVGPDGVIGGIEWGTATDGKRIYIANGNSAYVQATLYPSGQTTTGGFWSALDVNTGAILWQTPTFAPAPIPQGSARLGNPPPGTLAPAEGSMSVANGVAYGEDTAGTYVALDTATGKVLRSFNSGGAAISAPAIVDGSLYWTSGYAGDGYTNNKVYAFWTGLR